MLESSHPEENKLEIFKVWFYAIVVFQVKTPLTFMKFIMNKYKNDPLFMRVLEEGDSDVIEGAKFAGE